VSNQRIYQREFELKNKTLSLPAIICLIASSCLPVLSHAGFDAFTMHSRANCGGFNESISWHWGHPNKLLTYSRHTHPKASYSCYVDSGGCEMTWRSAACHFAEGYGGWHVIGTHYGLAPDRKTMIVLAITEADDCSIYDGWWDAK